MDITKQFPVNHADIRIYLALIAAIIFCLINDFPLLAKLSILTAHFASLVSFSWGRYNRIIIKNMRKEMVTQLALYTKARQEIDEKMGRIKRKLDGCICHKQKSE